MSMPVSEVASVEEVLSNELTLVDVELDVDLEEPASEPSIAPFQFLASIMQER